MEINQSDDYTTQSVVAVKIMSAKFEYEKTCGIRRVLFLVLKQRQAARQKRTNINARTHTNTLNTHTHNM